MAQQTGPDEPRPIEPENVRQLTITATAEERRISGPIPPPDILAEYERVVPGAADRILTMAEGQQKHRHQLENKVTDHNIDRTNRGQKLTFVLSLVVFIGAVIIAVFGNPAWAFSIMLADLLALLVVNLKSKNEQRRELQEKRERLAKVVQKPEP